MCVNRSRNRLSLPRKRTQTSEIRGKESGMYISKGIFHPCPVFLHVSSIADYRAIRTRPWHSRFDKIITREWLSVYISAVKTAGRDRTLAALGAILSPIAGAPRNKASVRHPFVYSTCDLTGSSLRVTVTEESAILLSRLTICKDPEKIFRRK